MYRLYVVSPLGALLRGFAAGAVGAETQNLFFKYTARIAPAMPQGVFEPPEQQQARETATETVARRAVEGLMKRGPLSQERKKRGATLVHFSFGALWGGLYGLARESFPALNSAAWVSGFSTVVWMVSDNGLYPGFKLGAAPHRYPVKVHLFAWAAHLAYGLGLWASYEATRRPFWDVAGAALWAFATRRKLRKVLPKRARPAARTVLDGLAAAYRVRPVDRVRAIARA